MKSILQCSGATFQWMQPKWGARYWELHAGGERIAMLAFRGLFSQIAEVASGDGAWTIQRQGFLRRQITASASQTGAVVAQIAPRWTGREATIALSDGREFVWRALNFWATRYELHHPAYESAIISYRLGLDRERLWGGFKTQAVMTVEDWSSAASELALLNFISWFLVIVTREDVSAAASAGGAS